MALSVILAFTMVMPGSAAGEKDRPNIMMIIIDDLNDWVGVMNSHPNADTPNIDKLAQRGTLFTNAHAAAPLCGPTRAALLSGLKPSTTGIYGHNNLSILKANKHVAKTVLVITRYAQKGGDLSNTRMAARNFMITGMILLSG